ncbi:MAG: DUF1566 domain-containing protein [Desulfobulbaceae bacterium]|nr:DUF1566 domain-containing protein [Desulfobulbaceae bacterium]
MMSVTLNWGDRLPDGKRFELVLGEEAVLDRETGLTWERKPDHSEVKKWHEAIIISYQKVIGGRKGWRLPSVEELLSLVDVTRSAPALPAGHPFLGISSYGYWTATSVVNAQGQGWVVNIGSGETDTDNKQSGLFVWAVRGGNGLM